MKPTFIETNNTKKFEEISAELISPTSLIGPSLALVTGPAGRGKTEAARHYAIHNGAIYIPPMNIRTPTMVLREITFELQNVRPQRSDACVLLISEAMAKERRLIFVDEADLLPMAILEMLRNLNEIAACPIMLIGEEALKAKIDGRRRLFSRIRRRLDFGPINQHDIAYFLRTALDVKVGPDVTSLIHNHAKGDWRLVLTAAIGIERSMKTSNLKEITVEMVHDVIENG
jgi:DNA transposition AAA+ family ATPase